MPDALALTPRWHFHAALWFTAIFSGVVAFLLASDLSQLTRRDVSSVGLVLSALIGCTFTTRAGLRSSGVRRRSWFLLTAAGLVAIFGNLMQAVLGDAPFGASNLPFLVAQIVAIVAMLSFPVERPRGSEATVRALDGVIIGMAVLTIVATVVYPQILSKLGGGFTERFTAYAFPVFDVVLATVCFTIIGRSRAESGVLILVGTGFLGFAFSDLAFLRLDAADGGYDFGTPIDLGWMASYLLIGAAALHPRAASPGPASEHAPRSDVRSTMVVFAVIVAAILVEVILGRDVATTATTSVMWVVLIAAAAGRQILLTYDNAKLRAGLEQRVAEQTSDLRRMARQTEVLVTSVGDGIYGVDEGGRITFANPSAAQMLGTAAPSLLGRRAHQEFHAPQDDSPHRWQDCYITQAIELGLISSVEDAYLRADGSAFPVEVTSSPIIDDDEITGAVVAFRDITHRREVDRIKSELLSVVSHELRTPLTSIRGSLGLISGGAAGPLTPAAQRIATVALRSSERLTRLLNDILDVERIDSGTLPMRKTVQDVSGLLEASAAVLADQARDGGIELVVRDAAGQVAADADRIVQTLTNLVSNALKFSAPGGRVEIAAEQVADEVLFCVRDCGRGIPEDKLESIFERFEQVDSSDARLEGGTGLGLAISRGIVDRHGGRIWAESTLGTGTTMRFTLPAVLPGDTPPG